MNSKNPKKGSAKAMPKKKVKSNAKPPNSPPKETKSKFYVTKDAKSVNEPPAVVAKKKSAAAEEPKKFERSNSFILTRTLSKIYSKLSGSKENLDKARDNDEKPKPARTEAAPFKFQRSLTLNSFQLKKNNYRSALPETRLENLSEEMIGEKSPPLSPPVTMRTAAFRQSMPLGSHDSVDFSQPVPPKLERSGSFISLMFKRKVSFNEPKSPLATSNWATSMQNLRQIDNMVSYEDLSFVDYDKFNQYEKKIDRLLTRQQSKSSNPPQSAPIVSSNTSPFPAIEAVNSTVVRRRKKKSLTRLMGDFNSNLDREKNLYRQSIDSNKLRFLSTINLDTHRWSRHYDSPMDWLSLENPPQAAKAIS